jgi:gliding motility-associated-like protein
LRRKLFTFCIFWLSLFLISGNVLNAQLQIVPGNVTPYTPANLISNVFLGEGVEVTSIIHNGDTDAVGYFSNGSSEIGMERGIIMSTGQAITAMEPNNDPGTSGSTSGMTVTDADLQAATNVDDLFDIVKYTISFIPVSDTLRFRYSFASEEYPEFTCSEFNDVFGFFITGPNPQGADYVGTNIALVPGTAQTVTINNVHNGNPTDPSCQPINSQYYNDNFGSLTMTYDAYLDVFVAEALVVPCEEYTIKLAIGDGSDPDWDSAVFLEAKSFGTGTLKATTETISIDGGVAEGCVQGELVFDLPNAPLQDYTIDYTIINSGFPDIAIPGFDYLSLPPNLTILAGETRFSFPIMAYEDGIDEGVEYIYIDYQKNVCSRDTIRIPVYDNNLISPDLPFLDSMICEGESILIDTEIPPELIIPDPPFFQNSNDLVIATANEAYYSDIVVSGVAPDLISDRIIKSVCIDSLHHRWLDDLDFYLVGPSGQIMELSTDNGEDGGNNVAEDSLINMCFSPSAITNVNNGDPIAGDLFGGNNTYTGEFAPEGTWVDIWGGEFPTNGNWRLLVIDDVDDSLIPVLHSWSICFETPYEINFEWGPNQDISCLDCEDPVVDPLSSTTYYITTTDSYGCQVVDSLDVSVENILSAPVLNCDSLSFDGLRVSWSAVNDASSYVVRINGMDPWIPANGNLSHLFVGLSADTDYTIEVQAAGGPCGGEISQVICRTLTCLAPDVQLVSSSSPTCFGGNNGTASFSASGTLGPYSYDLEGEISPTGVFVDLEAGPYTVYVTDGDNCTIGFDFTITATAEIALNGVPQNISCNGMDDGMISLSPSNGLFPYTFLWSTNEMTSSVSSLSQGWYYVTVTDANSCAKIDSFEIIEPELLAVDIEEIDVLCFGDDTGVATANVSGGILNYSYAWDDGASQITMAATNLVARNYTVVVTDANGCTVQASTDIVEPDRLTVTAMSQDLLCFDSQAGSASATAEGGDGNYTYEWSTMENGNMIDGISPGNYQVTVTDGNSCSAETSTMVGAPPEIVLTINITDNLCFGDTNGEIEILAMGGSGNFEYLVNGITVGNVITNLAANTYCISVIDDNSCQKDSCVEVGQPDQIGNDAIVTNVRCFASADGTIDLNPTGGTGPYTFSWTGPELFMADTEDVSGLNIGTYFVTVTDINDCTNQFQFDITQPPIIEIFENVRPVKCFGGSDGSVELTIFGGEEPFQFNWTGPNSFSSQEQNITDLETGNYTLLLTDNSGCLEMRNYEVLQPLLPLTLEISEPDTICFGADNGRASVVAEGGNGAYSFMWSSGGDGSVEMSLSDGNITVTVTDILGCVESASTSIVELDQINLTFSKEPADCFEGRTGSAEITSITYGNLQADPNNFTYLWNSVPPQFTAAADNLTGGETYSVIVEDQFGCTQTGEVTIEQPEPVLIDLVELQNASCNRGQDGSITVQGNGGVSPYDYSWDASTNFQIGPTAENIGFGIYEVTVSDANGCSSTMNYALDEPTRINLSFRVFDVLCHGESEGEIKVIISGGILPYQYNWSTGSTEEEITGLTSGMYFLTLTDNNGCEIMDSVAVLEPEEPLSLDYTTTDVSCFDGRDGSIRFIPSGGSGFYTYSIDGRIFNGAETQNGLEAGVYTIYLKDFKGCIDSIENVIIDEPVEIIVDLGPDITVRYGDDVPLNASIQNTNGVETYNWESSYLDKLSCLDCTDPVVLNALQGMTFKLNVIDEDFCQGSDVVNIYVAVSKILDVPTGFTPNNDGNNDLLRVFGSNDATINVFRVYSRWGELVFELENFDINEANIGWDGTFKGKEALPGVYVWQAEATFADGSIELFKGETTLIR